MSAKQDLQKLIQNLQTKKFREGEAKGLMSEIQKEQTNALKPVFEQLAKELVTNIKSELTNAVKDLKVDSPDIKLPEINISTENIERAISEGLKGIVIQSPKITMPPIPSPIVNVPETKVNIPDRFYAETELSKVDYKRPLPVRLFDANGKPFAFPISGGMSGGKADFFTIKGFEVSAFSELMNPDGRLKVELPSGSSGLTDTELRASSLSVSQVSGANWSVNVTGFSGTMGSNILNSDGETIDPRDRNWTISEIIPIQQVSGSNWSVSVVDIFGSTGANVVNPDGRLKVELPSGASGLTDTELRASSLPVEQVSGSAWSVYVKEIFGSTITNLLNGDNRIPVSIESGASGLTDTELRASSVPVSQASGANWSVTIAGALASIAVVNIDRDGNPQQTWLVSDVTNSVKSALIDSTGVQYSGSNPVPVKLVTNLVASTIAVGSTLHGVADIGSAPQKVGGIVMQANPTAEVGGDVSNFRTDDIGRQLMRPVQVRDLTVTAYATLTNGTETTLLSATAGSFHDLIYILASNNSTVAVGVDIRPVTGGNIVMHLEIPANGVVGVSTPVPIPQSTADTGNAWTADMGDITGTTVYLSALFAREI